MYLGILFWIQKQEEEDTSKQNNYKGEIFDLIIEKFTKKKIRIENPNKDEG